VREKLAVLFSRLIAALVKGVHRSGGKRLADQFEREINGFARQRGWNIPTGLADLGPGPSDLDTQALLDLYDSVLRYAEKLTAMILGERLMKSALADVLNSLPSDLAQLNAHYKFIRLSRVAAIREVE
jgi:hypothetical protein